MESFVKQVYASLSTKWTLSSAANHLLSIINNFFLCSTKFDLTESDIDGETSNSGIMKRGEIFA